MSASSLTRLGGLAAMMAGVMLSLGTLLAIVAVDFGDLIGSLTTPSYALAFGLYLFGTVLLLVGLVGLYAHQSEAAGVLGLVGFLLAFSGTTLTAGAAWTLLFAAPSVALGAPEFFEAIPPGPLVPGLVVTLALVGVGWVLFGVATIRAGVYPRMAAIVLMVGALVSFIPTSLSSIILDVAVAWLGFVLFTGRGEETQKPTRAS